MSREKVKELISDLASNMEYVHLKDAVEIFEEEMAMRLYESFGEYVEDCELRGDREYVTCTKCLAHDECAEIHNIEKETGIWFEDLLDNECECVENCGCEECESEDLTDEEICEILHALYGHEDESEEECEYKISLDENKLKEEKKKDLSKELVVEAISSFLDLLVLLS